MLSLFSSFEQWKESVFPKYLQIDNKRRSVVEKTEKQRKTDLGLHLAYRKHKKEIILKCIIESSLIFILSNTTKFSSLYWNAPRIINTTRRKQQRFVATSIFLAGKLTPREAAPCGSAHVSWWWRHTPLPSTSCISLMNRITWENAGFQALHTLPPDFIPWFWAGGWESSLNDYLVRFLSGPRLKWGHQTALGTKLKGMLKSQ